MSACGQEGSVETGLEARAAMEAYVQALNEGDIETAAGMYDTGPGFHWIERGGVQYESGSQAAASLRQLSQDGGSTRMIMEQIQVAELGEGAALVSGYFTITRYSDDGSAQFSFDGWMTVGMTKRADGWRIAGGQTGPGPDEETQEEQNHDD
jgi:ketosteroid isomerase-like protein